MQINPYLNFNGDCEAAFTFYEQCLGGQRGGTFRYGGSPMAGSVPPDWSEKVMHASITIGDMLLQGGDVVPAQYEAPKGFSLTIQSKDTAEAERIFEQLATGGSVTMPLEETFWAARFGMVVDRFGVPWLINCEGSGQPAAV
jgi:PhnB protein